MVDLNDRELIREFIKRNDIKDLFQLDDLFKKMMGAIIEGVLEAERDEYLGYQRYQRSESTNSRNDYSSKTMRSSQGDMKITIPRAREGQFQPELIKKYQRDVSQIEDNIISLYAKGMTIRDIQSHLQEIYGVEISLQTISNIIDRIIPFLDEWRSRPLKEIYIIIYIDSQRFKVRSGGTLKEKVVYTVLEIDIDGNKNILGL